MAKTSRRLHVNAGINSAIDEDMTFRSVSPVSSGIQNDFIGMKDLKPLHPSANIDVIVESETRKNAKADTSKLQSNATRRDAGNAYETTNNIQVMSKKKERTIIQKNDKKATNLESDILSTPEISDQLSEDKLAISSMNKDMSTSDNSEIDLPRSICSSRSMSGNDDLYCVDHAKVCSAQEALEKHGGCNYLVSATKWREAQIMERDKTKVTTQLDRIYNFAGLMIQERNEFRTAICESKKHVNEEFLTFLEDVIENLLKKKKAFMTQLKDIHQAYLKDIDNNIRHCKILQMETAQYIKQLEEYVPGSERYTDITKHIQKQCLVYEEILRRNYLGATRIEYEFQPNQWVNEEFNNLDAIGHLTMSQKASELPEALKTSMENDFDTAPLSKTVLLVGSSTNDKSPSYFSGCTFISDGRLIVADWNNMSLKMFTRQLLIVCTLELSSNPFDVKQMSGNEVVVTVPGEHRVYIVGFKSLKMEVLSFFDTDCECWGIVPIGDKYATTCDPWSKNPCVKIISQAGKVLSFFHKDQNGQPLFRFPEHITTDYHQNVLYVSDARNHMVIAITLEGYALFRYGNKTLQHPSGLVTDKQGNIYVCGKESGNVHKISESGEFLRLLLDKSDIDGPKAICFDTDTQSLAVTDVGPEKSGEIVILSVLQML